MKIRFLNEVSGVAKIYRSLQIDFTQACNQIGGKLEIKGDKYICYITNQVTASLDRKGDEISVVFSWRDKYNITMLNIQNITSDTGYFVVKSETDTCIIDKSGFIKGKFYGIRPFYGIVYR